MRLPACQHAMHPVARNVGARGAGPCLITSRRFSRTPKSTSMRPTGVAIVAVSGLDDDRVVEYDPEGLFKNQAKVSFFKDDEKADKSDVVDAGRLPPIDPRFLARHPIRPLKGSLSDMKRFKKMLEQRFMPMDVDNPSVEVLHLDPPVVIVRDVFTNAECEDVIAKLAGTGRMAASTIGAGNLYAENVVSNRRTSSSVLINDELQGEFPEIKAFAEELQRRCKALLTAGARAAATWGVPGKAMLFGQYAFEGMQGAVYKEGQHFLEHEDAFPIALADENRFQRQATCLLYLNTVDEGGETEFSYLDISVKPTAGSLLVFFPAFSDFEPDPRTLHVARQAVDDKWVVQQWVARGYSSTLAAHDLEQKAKASSVERLSKSKGKKKKRKSAGFG